MTNAANTPPLGRRLRLRLRNEWMISVWMLLGVLLVWYSTLIPTFGTFQITSISKNSLPLVYLAVGSGDHCDRWWH